MWKVAGEAKRGREAGLTPSPSPSGLCLLPTRCAPLPFVIYAYDQNYQQ